MRSLVSILILVLCASAAWPSSAPSPRRAKAIVEGNPFGNAAIWVKFDRRLMPFIKPTTFEWAATIDGRFYDESGPPSSIGNRWAVIPMSYTESAPNTSDEVSYNAAGQSVVGRNGQPAAPFTIPLKIVD